MYAWAIVQNNIGRDMPIRWSGDCRMTRKEIASHEKAQRFRLVDGDGEACCYGYFVALDDTPSGFEPLDNYGESMGCVEIQYLEGGKYTSL